MTKPSKFNYRQTAEFLSAFVKFPFKFDKLKPGQKGYIRRIHNRLQQSDRVASGARFIPIKKIKGESNYHYNRRLANLKRQYGQGDIPGLKGIFANVPNKATYRWVKNGTVLQLGSKTNKFYKEQWIHIPAEIMLNESLRENHIAALFAEYRKKRWYSASIWIGKNRSTTVELTNDGLRTILTELVRLIELGESGEVVTNLISGLIFRKGVRPLDPSKIPINRRSITTRERHWKRTGRHR